jgi:hypothetical protein
MIAPNRFRFIEDWIGHVLMSILRGIAALAVSTHQHIMNWLEVYLWVPVSLIGIFGAAQLAYFLTGRRPTENADWLVDYSSKAVQCVAVIALTSIAKQALGSWLTRDQKIENPYVYTINTISTLIIFGIITYLFKN